MGGRNGCSISRFLWVVLFKVADRLNHVRLSARQTRRSISTHGLSLCCTVSLGTCYTGERVRDGLVLLGRRFSDWAEAANIDSRRSAGSSSCNTSIPEAQSGDYICSHWRYGNIFRLDSDWAWTLVTSPRFA